MIYKRMLVTMMLVLLLQACASPKMAQEVQQGKSNFANGDFTKAYHALLPAAVAGNPEAEYAVGYLYYYGFGIERDSVSGLFWMRKAAEQNYLPAQNALILIQEKSRAAAAAVPPKELPRIRQVEVRIKPSVNVAQKDEVLQSLPVIKKPLAMAAARGKGALAQLKKAMLPLTKAHYSLQLVGDYTVGNVRGLQRSLALQKNTQIWRTHYKGNDWFVLTYGAYPTAAVAKLALKNLPHTLSGMHPWIRSVEKLQKA